MKKNVNISTRSLTVYSVDCGGELWRNLFTKVSIHCRRWSS